MTCCHGFIELALKDVSKLESLWCCTSSQSIENRKHYTMRNCNESHRMGHTLADTTRLRVVNMPHFLKISCNICRKPGQTSLAKLRGLFEIFPFGLNFGSFSAIFKGDSIQGCPKTSCTLTQLIDRLYQL